MNETKEEKQEMKRALLVWFCVAGLVVMGCSPTADRGDSFGRMGTLDDSWVEIWDWNDLDAIRHNLNGSYTLMIDIDSTSAGYEELAGPDANDGKGWQPIGTSADPFTGTFDGQGYEIRDLRIDRPGEDRVGLFGAISEGALIEHTGVADAVVVGRRHVGGLVGYNYYHSPAIRNSYSTGSVTGYSSVGGLVGYGYQSTVSDSYSTGSVTGHHNVGGLVGHIWLATVSNSYSSATVAGDSHHVGGLVGSIDGSTVSNSYATGSVSGGRNVGGLVGHVESLSVSNSYATGSVIGDENVGGLVGYLERGRVSNSYYDYDAVLINEQKVITIGALFGEDFDEWLAQDKFLDVNERLSQEDGYYLINNASDFKQLLAFAQDDSLKFRLKSDLDLGNDPNFYIPYLAGEFHGNGHRISNLSFSFDSVSQIGLFGYLAGGGKINEVGVENVNIIAKSDVGGLVGRNNDGAVHASYATGSVTGDRHVGGVVGRNRGSAMHYQGIVSNSHFTGSVTGDVNVGGVVGNNFYMVTVSNSHSTGSVTGSTNVGGLVGNHYRGTIDHSHSSASVSGNEAVGGLVGRNALDGIVSNSYSSGSVTSDSLVGGLVGYNFAGTVSNSYYDYDKVLVNGENIITIGALFAEDYEEWLANDKYLDVNDRLSQEEGCYMIGDFSDFKQLLVFGQDDSLKFGLINDLDLATEPNFYIPYLAGEFDGNGHRISNLSFDFDFVSQVGLFGQLVPDAKVGQVGVEGVDLTGDEAVGGLVGRNRGDIVTKSYSGGSVSGRRHIGGLVGYNSKTVSNSYSSASVTGDEAVGGLVGYQHYGTVSRSYSSGAVSGEQNVGGLVGRVISGELRVSDSFWDLQSSAVEVSAGGTGKTTAEMQDIATLTDIATEGLDDPWDMVLIEQFNPSQPSTWFIDHGIDYPRLFFENPDYPPLTLPTVTTEAATDVITDSATLNMNFTVGDYSPVNVRFSWREFDTDPWLETTWTSKAADGTHAEMLTGLDADTTYEFKAQLGYDTTVTDGTVLTFTTAVEPIDPTVTTEPAIDVTTSAAVLHGDLDIGDETSVDVFFRYRETGEVAWIETPSQPMTESGTFDAAVTDLASNTEHEFKAGVQWDGQENVGDILTFKTLAIEPTVTTEEATDVTTDSATLNMGFTVGDYSPVEVRFSWREEGTDPWIETTWTSKAADGTHAETLTGLGSDTTYEFKAQLRHNAAVVDGDALTFTTKEEIPAVCVPTDTGTGMACLTASHGTIEDLQAVPAVSPAPRGVNFPHGMFEFKITGLAEGATVTLTVELPEAVPVGTVWWKYQDGSWYPLPNESDDGDNIMTIKLTDGGLGDSPGSDPGTIVDPGGPGNPVPPLTVGWEGSPVNKAAVVAPWIALFAVIAGASLLLVLRRRGVQD